MNPTKISCGYLANIFQKYYETTWKNYKIRSQTNTATIFYTNIALHLLRSHPCPKEVGAALLTDGS